MYRKETFKWHILGNFRLYQNYSLCNIHLNDSMKSKWENRCWPIMLFYKMKFICFFCVYFSMQYMLLATSQISHHNFHTFIWMKTVQSKFHLTDNHKSMWKVKMWGFSLFDQRHFRIEKFPAVIIPEGRINTIIGAIYKFGVWAKCGKHIDLSWWFSWK